MPRIERLTHVFKHQPDAVLSQANPVSGTKYTVLETTANVRILNINASCTWTGVQPTLAVWVTMDGNTIRYQIINPVSTVKHHAVDDGGSSELWQTLHANFYPRAFLLEGRSVKVEAETTGGTASSLDVRMKYAKL